MLAREDVLPFPVSEFVVPFGVDLPGREGEYFRKVSSTSLVHYILREAIFGSSDEYSVHEQVKATAFGCNMQDQDDKDVFLASPLVQGSRRCSKRNRRKKRRAQSSPSSPK